MMRTKTTAVCGWQFGSHKWGNQIDFLRTQGELKQREDFKNLATFSPPNDADIAQVEAHLGPLSAARSLFTTR